MTPVWKIRSGKFAGWYSSDALYDEGGRYIGFLAGPIAYSTHGKYLGEIHDAAWIGRAPGVHANHAGPYPHGDNLAHAPLADRVAHNLPGWEDPEY
jgi:hypothetical protein